MDLAEYSDNDIEIIETTFAPAVATRRTHNNESDDDDVVCPGSAGVATVAATGRVTLNAPHLHGNPQSSSGWLCTACPFGKRYRDIVQARALCGSSKGTSPDELSVNRVQALEPSLVAHEFTTEGQKLQLPQQQTFVVETKGWSASVVCENKSKKRKRERQKESESAKALG